MSVYFELIGLDTFDLTNAMNFATRQTHAGKLNAIRSIKRRSIKRIYTRRCEFRVTSSRHRSSVINKRD